MNKSNQVLQSIDFRVVHAEAIQRTQEAILGAAKRLIKAGEPHLPEDVRKAAHEAIQQANLQGFFSVIRPIVAEVRDPGLRNSLWDIIDAAGFYSDATEAQWPYMTESKRKTSLQWAADHASMIQ